MLKNICIILFTPDCDTLVPSNSTLFLNSCISLCLLCVVDLTGAGDLGKVVMLV